VITGVEDPHFFTSLLEGDNEVDESNKAINQLK